MLFSLTPLCGNLRGPQCQGGHSEGQKYPRHKNGNLCILRRTIGHAFPERNPCAIDGRRFTGTFISEDLQCYRRQPINILRHEMVRLCRGSDGLQIAGYSELRKKDVRFIGFCLECSKCMISQCVESSKQRPTFAFDSDKTAIQGMDFQQMQLALLSLSHQEIATFLHHL